MELKLNSESIAEKKKRNQRAIVRTTKNEVRKITN